MPGVASRREVAELEVSASTTIVWVKCFRAPGETISPLEKNASFLLGLIKQQPDVTLDELDSAHGRAVARHAIDSTIVRASTRYEKTARAYLSMLCIAATRLWIKIHALAPSARPHRAKRSVGLGFRMAYGGRCHRNRKGVTLC